jgi:hypothetical protein
MRGDQLTAMWHDDPNLQGRFHPQYPDDLQVVLHEGSFRFTRAKPEIVWGRIQLGLEFEFEGNPPQIVRAYRASLLNQPVQLKTFKVGQDIMLVAHKSYKLPIYVTHEYVADRAQYHITPCNECGLPELFDPISKLVEHSFPGMKETLKKEEGAFPMFTSFCPVCGGTMVVKHKALGAAAPMAARMPKTAPKENLFAKFKKWFGRS